MSYIYIYCHYIVIIVHQRCLCIMCWATPMLRRLRRHRRHRHPGPIQGRLQAAAPHVHGQDGRDHRTSYIVYIGIKKNQNIKGFRKIDWLELDRIGWNRNIRVILELSELAKHRLNCQSRQNETIQPFCYLYLDLFGRWYIGDMQVMFPISARCASWCSFN